MGGGVVPVAQAGEVAEEGGAGDAFGEGFGDAGDQQNMGEVRVEAEDRIQCEGGGLKAAGGEQGAAGAEAGDCDAADGGAGEDGGEGGDAGGDGDGGAVEAEMGVIGGEHDAREGVAEIKQNDEGEDQRCAGAGEKLRERVDYGGAELGGDGAGGVGGGRGWFACEQGGDGADELERDHQEQGGVPTDGGGEGDDARTGDQHGGAIAPDIASDGGAHGGEREKFDAPGIDHDVLAGGAKRDEGAEGEGGGEVMGGVGESEAENGAGEAELGDQQPAAAAAKGAKGRWGAEMVECRGPEEFE